MSYACLRSPLVDASGRALVSLRAEDMIEIGRWRNEQMDALRQSTPLSDEDQRRYFREVVTPTMSQAQPRMILVSYLLDGTCIGYGGLVHLDWQAGRAEVSFLVATHRTLDAAAYRADFTAFLALLRQLAFERLPLKRLFTETYDIRPHHVAALEAAGFRPEGRLRRHQFVAGRLVDTLFHGMLSEEHRG